MSSRARFSGLGLAVSLAVLAPGAPVSAAPAPIGGTLSQSDYTVITLAANGQAASAVARDGRFSLVPPAESVTLHLRAPDGRYAGPVVLQEAGNPLKSARAAVRKAKRKVKRAKRKVRRAQLKVKTARPGHATRQAAKRLKKARQRLRRARKRLRKAKARLREVRRQRAARPFVAILGVRAGASLGSVEVNTTAGYALARGVRKAWIDAQRLAQAAGGVPIGAGNFGRVSSARSDGAAIGDRDLDGVPEPLDIDDDGDLILDGLDTGPQGPRAAQVDNSLFGISSQLTLGLQQTANANHPVLAGRIESALAGPGGELLIQRLVGAAAELDCGGSIQQPPRQVGLSYCSHGASGSTGRVGGTPFPGPPSDACCFDLDGDGFGTLVVPSAPSGVFLRHGATSAEIGTGDVMMEHVTTTGSESQCPDSFNPACVTYTNTLQYVFATVPALVSFSDGVGPAVTVDYGEPDPANGGFVVEPRPSGDPNAGDVVLTMTFWRPQRSRIATDPAPGPGESAAWTDIGRLSYAMGVDSGGALCPESTFSDLSPPLTAPVLIPTSPGAAGFSDTADDHPANPQNTFTFTLNVTECLAARGLPPWNPGEPRSLTFIALAPTATGGRAGQGLGFKRAEP